MNASSPKSISVSENTGNTKAVSAEKLKSKGWWKNISFKSYFAELKGIWILKCLLMAATCYLFQVPLKIVVNTILVQPLLRFAVTDNYFVDAMLAASMGYGLIYLFQQLRSGRFITVPAVIFYAASALVYLLLFRFASEYSFYCFKLPVLSGFAYADFFLLSAALRLASYKTYRVPLKISTGTLSLLEDYPSMGGYTDMFGYTGYAGSVAAHINATTTESSFGIGLTGSWGSGKTDFLMRLEAELLKNKGQNLVFRFNPWLVKSDAIVDEFFKTLSNVLRPFDKSVSKDLKEYSKRILQTGKEVHYRALDALINNWVDDDTLLKKYTNINEAIGLTGKRLIVMVDDLDRLSGKEIMEVLRIIRNTANFRNIFFVVALDQKYIIDALKNTKDFANEEEYLKKIFQLVIMLPAFKQSLMAEEAMKFLVTDDAAEQDRKLITDIIKRISWDTKDMVNVLFPAADQSGIFEDFISNVRELKRFANSFKITFKILKTEVDSTDLFVLELIKNKYIEIYNLIRNRRLLDFHKDRPAEFILNEAQLTALAGYSEREKKEIGEGIKFLTSASGKNQRRFVNVQNFYLYFSYQLFDQISFAEFNETMTKDAHEIVPVFNGWIKEGKFNELDNILRDFTVFKDADDFYKMTIVFLGIAKGHEVYRARVQHLLYQNRKENLRRYFENDEGKFRDFLRKLVADQRISNVDKSLILHQFLAPLSGPSTEENAIFNDKTQIQKMLLELLETELVRGVPLYNGAMGILYNNFDLNPGDGKPVQLYAPALQLMKADLMRNEEHFKDYLVRIIRPQGQPYDGTVVFEPFHDKIFTDQTSFIEKVKATTFGDVEERKHSVLREVVLKYAPERPGAAPFIIEDSDQRKVLEELMKENGTINMESDLLDIE